MQTGQWFNMRFAYSIIFSETYKNNIFTEKHQNLTRASDDAVSWGMATTIRPSALHTIADVLYC